MLSRKRLLLLKKKALLLKKKRLASVKRHRKYWIHPINRSRQDHSVYYRLVTELRGDEARFKKYFRMTPTNFDHLLSLVKPYLVKKDTRMRKAIVPGLKLAITLHHLAEGASHSAIAAHYRLGRSTTSIAIYDTLAALWKVLQPIYLKPPTGPTEWKIISEG